MPIHGVVAEIGRAADEPTRKGRTAGVADLRGRCLPIDAPGLLGPEGIALIERATLEIGKGLHGA
jgi:hypothetical protein